MEKMTFKQKLQNFWYHSKYTFLAFCLFAIFIIVAIVQIFTKDSPDANFCYMGTSSISFTSGNILQESVGVFMKEDYNGDGKKTIDYIELTVLDPKKAQNFDQTTYTSHEIDKVAGERFVAELVGGDSMIYLADEKYYKMALEQNILMPLNKILDTVPDFAHDEYSVLLRDLEIFYLPGFNKLPGDTVVFVRYPVSVADSKKSLKEREKCNLSVFRDMFEYVHPDKPEDKVKVAQRVTSEKFVELYGEWCKKNKVAISEEPIFKELTSDETFEKTGATVYKCEGRTFIIFEEKIYSVGRSTDGDGVVDIDICDFDNDGIMDFIFTYTYRENEVWKAEASVFNLTKLRETFLRLRTEIPDGALLALEKISNSEFILWQTNVSEEDLSSDITSMPKSESVCSIVANGGNIATKIIK